jgi:hypothetical protein
MVLIAGLVDFRQGMLLIEWTIKIPRGRAEDSADADVASIRMSTALIDCWRLVWRLRIK